MLHRGATRKLRPRPVINLFFLFTISLISFGTALFGAYASNPLAVTVYTVMLVAVGFSLFRLWRYADGHGLLVAGTAPADYDPQVVAVRTVIFLSAIPLSLLTPWAPLIWLLEHARDPDHRAARAAAP